MPFKKEKIVTKDKVAERDETLQRTENLELVKANDTDTLSNDEQKVLWNNPSVHCVNICRYDWFNKQADWPIAKQDKAR